MRRTTPEEMEAVLRLDGPSRYAHFVKRVVDEEVAWVLWHDGWALMADTDGQSVFPLWPAREYAQMFAVGKWECFSVEEIPLADLLDELLPKLADRKMAPGVFPTPTGKGVVPTAEELISAMRAEMLKYE
jgi:hypothetical protein